MLLWMGQCNPVQPTIYWTGLDCHTTTSHDEGKHSYQSECGTWEHGSLAAITFLDQHPLVSRRVCRVQKTLLTAEASQATVCTPSPEPTSKISKLLSSNKVSFQQLTNINFAAVFWSFSLTQSSDNGQQLSNYSVTFDLLHNFMLTKALLPSMCYTGSLLLSTGVSRVEMTLPALMEKQKREKNRLRRSFCSQKDNVYWIQQFITIQYSSEHTENLLHMYTDEMPVEHQTPQICFQW